MVAGGMVVPMGFIVAKVSHSLPTVLRGVGIAALVIVATSVLAGVLFAIPTLLARPAYDRVLGGTDPE